MSWNSCSFIENQSSDLKTQALKMISLRELDIELWQWLDVSSQVEFVESIPKLPSGKILRKDLRKLEESRRK